MPLILPQSLQQPQQFVPIDRSTRIGAGAVAVVTPALLINWATGVPLTRGNTVSTRYVTTGGLRSFSFNKDYWLETETLPAVGTKPFVMFWLGWPTGVGTGGLGPNEATFVVGSSNNSLGILSAMGSVRAVANWGGNNTPSQWGACVNTWSTNYTSLDTIPVSPAGAPSMLAVVRLSSGTIQFWRNGVLVNTWSTALTSVAAFKMEVGSWIAQANWTTSNNTALAGLSVLNSDPTASELAAFGANPWSLFKSSSMLPMIASLLGASAIPRRALILQAGAIKQVADALIGTNQKPLVLYLGQVRQRVASEGAPIVIVNGEIRTLAANEQLIL